MPPPPPRIVSVFEQIDNEHIYVCTSSSATVFGACLLAFCWPITFDRGRRGRRAPPVAPVATASLAETEAKIKTSSQETASPSLYLFAVSERLRFC